MHGVFDRKKKLRTQGWTLKYGEQSLTRILQIVNPKGEMKGSAITGPVGKEAAELWPVCSLIAHSSILEPH